MFLSFQQPLSVGQSARGHRLRAQSLGFWEFQARLLKAPYQTKPLLFPRRSESLNSPQIPWDLVFILAAFLKFGILCQRSGIKDWFSSSTAHPQSFFTCSGYLCLHLMYLGGMLPPSLTIIALDRVFPLLPFLQEMQLTFIFMVSESDRFGLTGVEFGRQL